MFQLSKEELENWRSQFVTSNPSANMGLRRPPYAFTEHGISMLSSILKSKIAIEINIKIIRTFTEMKRYLSSNDLLFERFERIESRLSKHDNNFTQLFKALEDKNKKPDQIIFYNGQIYDAHTFILDLIKSAKKSITLIDNYIDNNTLTMLSNNQEANITIYTQTISKQLKLDIDKYNEQYPTLKAYTDKTFHDRYLIIDSDKVYNIGASIKDVGNKTFTVTLLCDFCENDILNRRKIK